MIEAGFAGLRRLGCGSTRLSSGCTARCRLSSAGRVGRKYIRDHIWCTTHRGDPEARELCSSDRVGRLGQSIVRYRLPRLGFGTDPLASCRPAAATPTASSILDNAEACTGSHESVKACPRVHDPMVATGFSEQIMRKEACWRDMCCPGDELPPGTRKFLNPTGPIAVFNIRRVLRLLTACPHQARRCRGSAARLPGHILRPRLDLNTPNLGEIIRCPWHGWNSTSVPGKPSATPNDFGRAPSSVQCRTGVPPW